MDHLEQFLYLQKEFNKLKVRHNALEKFSIDMIPPLRGGSGGGMSGADTGFDLTTKGDIHVYSTQNARLPVGPNTQVLTADSAQALGVKWAAAAGGGSLELIESHIFDGTEETFTITKTFDANLYAGVMIYAGGSLADNLGLRVNGITGSVYTVRGETWITSTTFFNNALANKYQLSNGDVNKFTAIIFIMSPDVARHPFGSAVINMDGKSSHSGFSTGGSAFNDITSLTLLADDGVTNFVADSHFSVFGVKRT